VQTILENDLLCVLCDENGAQLTSIKGKKDSMEYLWNADLNYWNRHAPILFPIVGKVKNNKYRIDDKEYSLLQHGFARDKKFQVISVSSNKVVYQLSSNEETFQNYPFHFQLNVEYSLENNNLIVVYKINNKDKGDLFFSIGAHPGFNCPLLESETMGDYYLEFNEKETVSREVIDVDTGLLTGVSEAFLRNENIINLNKDLFKNDAIIFKNLKSTEVSLKSYKNSKKLTMNFTGFPYLGIWSKPGGAPFICIEPWFGHADFVDFNGDFREKSAIIRLEKDREFTCTYTISIEQ
jgi:galactose mutarotase-like enzyme